MKGESAPKMFSSVGFENVTFELSPYSSSVFAAAAAKSLQSCPTLCNPRDGSPPGSPVPGILQARTLEWVAISFSNAWKWKVKMKLLSHVRLLATPRTAAYQAPLSTGFLLADPNWQVHTENNFLQCPSTENTHLDQTEPFHEGSGVN